MFIFKLKLLHEYNYTDQVNRYRIVLGSMCNINGKYFQNKRLIGIRGVNFLVKTKTLGLFMYTHIPLSLIERQNIMHRCNQELSCFWFISFRYIINGY